ncbi:MFS transporter [Immundisolibacter sp.]|uniref:MFS transporter n=1 Tax=Immundisolibacter sp. TaxID=1934948 RepID=UPI003569D7FC
MTESPRTWDVADRLNAAPLGSWHWVVLALTFAVAAVDGLDAQIIGFTAPQLAAELGIGNDRLGPVFSAALLGMTGGALLFGGLGDRLGRRRMLIFCVLLFGGGTLVTVFAHSVQALLVLRLVTGLGLGGALPNAVTLMAECAPARHRPLLVTLMYIGFSVGGLFGGVVAEALVVEHGWRAMFYVGGGLPLGLALVLWWLLPESPHYLTRTGAGGERLARLLGRFDRAGGYAPHDRYVLAEAAPGARLSALFEGQRRRNTLLLWLAFFINLLVLFFLLNWLPKLLVDHGVSLALAIRTTVMFNIGGVLGALVLAWLSSRYNPRRMLATFFALGAVSIMAIGFGDGHFLPVAMACLATGLFAGAAQVGLYPIATQVYPSAVRATGVGWAQAWGRIGSIFGPLAGGWLAVLEPQFVVYFLLFGAPLLLAAAAIAAMHDVGVAEHQYDGAATGRHPQPEERQP